MILTNENYLEKAEQVIDNLRKNDKGLILLTTTKLRKILSMVSEIYSDASRIREEKLDAEMRSRLQYLKLHIVYEEGREPTVKDFVKKSELIGALDEVEDSKSKLIVFCHYVEALVAYRKFKGNDK